MAIEIIIVVVGCLVSWYSFQLVSKLNVVVTLKFESGVYDFNLENSGHYSIAILGAGSVLEKKKLRLQLATNGEQAFELTTRWSPRWRFRKDGMVGVEVWYFKIDHPGSVTLMLPDLNDLEVRKTMLPLTGFFKERSKSDELKIVICETAQLGYKLLANISLGVSLVFVIINTGSLFAKLLLSIL